jgi:hypothetical protein
MIDPATSYPPGQFPVSAGFAERLLEVTDSGRRTTTYKLAVLLVVLDLCARHSDARAGADGAIYPGRRRAGSGLVLAAGRPVPGPRRGACRGTTADHAAKGTHRGSGQRVPVRSRGRRGHVVASNPAAAARAISGDAGPG